MRRGIFFTMDAVLAFYIALIFMSLTMVLIESAQNYSEDSSYLALLSRDVREVQSYDPAYSLPDFIKTGSECNGAESVGSALVLRYSDIQSGNWTVKSDITTPLNRVCIDE